MPPHSGQGNPVTCRKPHKGRSPKDSKKGAPSKASGQPRVNAERHWRSGSLSGKPVLALLVFSAKSNGGGHGTAVGELLGHIVHADEGDGQREDHADTAQQAADGADDAQNQRTEN